MTTETKFGQIGRGVGFASTDGVIRKLTLRDKLQQVINLGQPCKIERQLVSVSDAKYALERYEDYYLDRLVGID